MNCGVELFKSGVLEIQSRSARYSGSGDHGRPEDAELFVRKLDEIDVKTIKSVAVDNLKDARKAAADLGYPTLLSVRHMRRVD